MQITSVDVNVFDNENSKMKGIASVILDDCFVVRDIRILDGNDGKNVCRCNTCRI